MTKLMRDPGDELRRTWKRHAARGYVCGCPHCDGVTLPLGKSRSAERRDWQREAEGDRP